ncbi:hypothetical protein [Pandoraea sp. NPDC087047]|uniref:hypothetical protein n=1 Tax=Pandoraea sp. NPDC087047 TaxID=3364390 RepID=UPI003830E6A1
MKNPLDVGTTGTRRAEKLRGRAPVAREKKTATASVRQACASVRKAVDFVKLLFWMTM